MTLVIFRRMAKSVYWNEQFEVNHTQTPNKKKCFKNISNA